MSIHAVKREQANLTWDNSIPPAITIDSGDTVSFDCLDASNGQLTASSTAADVVRMVFSQCDQVNGPVFVRGARPGDTLQVDVLELQPGAWGWTAIIPGFGLLADDPEFQEAALKIWDLERDLEEGVTTFRERVDLGVGAAGSALERIRVPIRPFCGEMGVARREQGAFSTIPPYHTGGNMDTRHLTRGSTLFLPVEVEGGLFSVGDGHAAQGDGEVAGTAIETSMKVKVRLTVRKDKPYVNTPHFVSRTAERGAEMGYYTTTGVDPDVREAARSAVRNMISFLAAEHGLDRREAYMLCSVAGDLRMHEVVDMPHYLIGMMMPESVLSGH
ncbi:Formamidase [Coniophora puteana RWD-64-598 SS2]|uniref:Formamidase n=1 Tax=Coniophora puteana (strain RWD-64-598) TaxID=741705 RepID=A0A5M3MHB6_CONPW|nr:Formamidase [Coniophora puteana RWD-64-598 SS2]EIW78025.1 Formamidase [Coniophora puteana RWD-64-598 SS2]